MLEKIASIKKKKKVRLISKIIGAEVWGDPEEKALTFLGTKTEKRKEK